LTRAQPDVDAGFDQVNVPVIEDDFDVESGMLRQESRQTRYDVQTAEKASTRPDRRTSPSAGAARLRLWRSQGTQPAPVRLFP
jgi:hypothetical protein